MFSCKLHLEKGIPNFRSMLDLVHLRKQASSCKLFTRLTRVIRQPNGEEILEEENTNIAIISLQVWCEGPDGKV